MADFYSATVGPEIYPLIFLFCIITFGFLIPLTLNPEPSGSDVYFHMAHTQRMANSESLLDFYDASLHEESLGYDYPFGMWVFGAAVMKVTGSSVFEVAIVLPILIAIISLMMYFVYADSLIQSRRYALFAVIFLVSMPYLALNMLNYSTSRFITPLLIAIIFLSLQKFSIRNTIFISILCFALVFTHTGTYLFLLIFASIYFISYAVLWKRYAWGSYITILALLLLYVFTMDLFPIIQNQYIDKGRMVLSLGDSLSSYTTLAFFRDAADIFYNNFFVQNNLTYAILWAGFIFSVAAVTIHLRKKVKAVLPKFSLTVPLIGNLSNISHSIVTTPFWVGPIQSVLSIPGVFRLDRRGICIFVALVTGSLIPGAMQSGEGTGALREIYYLFLIIPVTAAMGLLYSVIWLKRWERKKTHQWLARGVYLLILVPLIAAPIVGTIHYLPGISGTTGEMVSLEWLGSTGHRFEGVTDVPYRERIDLYANKSTPDIHPGYETKQYTRDLYNSLFYSGAENDTRDLQIFNIQYIISSDRLLRELGKSAGSLRIDSNTEVNKVYSSDGNFGIYKIIPPEVTIVANVTSYQSNDTRNAPAIRFDEHPPSLTDLGSFYLCENAYYKVKFGKETPRIYYLGTKEDNILGEGQSTESVTLIESGKANPDYVEAILDEVPYEKVIIGDGTITYSTTLRQEGTGDPWATCQVTYTLYEKAIKRSVLITHNRSADIDNPTLNVQFGGSFFIPLSQFEFTEVGEGQNSQVSRRVYPSQDLISLKDKQITNIFLEGQTAGMMISFGNAAPYPEQITYKGSTQYEYGYLNYYTRTTIVPTEPVLFEEYWAIGTREETTRNLGLYRSVSLSDYPRGVIPAVIVGYADPETNASALSSIIAEMGSLGAPYSVAAQNASIGGMETEFAYVGTDPRANISERQGVLAREVERTSPTRVTQGIYFKDFTFSPSSISLMDRKHIPCAVGIPVNPPSYGMNTNGARLLKTAHPGGVEGDVVLFPVSLPRSKLIATGYSLDQVYASWLSVTSILSSTRGIGVFDMDADDLLATGDVHPIRGFIQDAKAKGVVFFKATDIARHFLAMRSVRVSVHRGTDEAWLNITNVGSGDVKDATVVLLMPLITDENSYIIDNGQISRVVLQGSDLQLYIAVDLHPGESKDIHITPVVARKLLSVDFEGLSQGRNRLVVRDPYGETVPGAIVVMDNTTYITDENGIASIWMRRGLHTFRIEKPGYSTLELEREIKGKIFRLIPSMKGN